MKIFFLFINFVFFFYYFLWPLLLLAAVFVLFSPVIIIMGTCCACVYVERLIKSNKIYFFSFSPVRVLRAYKFTNKIIVGKAFFVVKFYFLLFGQKFINKQKFKNFIDKTTCKIFLLNL